MRTGWGPTYVVELSETRSVLHGQCRTTCTSSSATDFLLAGGHTSTNILVVERAQEFFFTQKRFFRPEQDPWSKRIWKLLHSLCKSRSRRPSCLRVFCSGANKLRVFPSLQQLPN